MHSARPMPRGYFFRNGTELSDHRNHGAKINGLGIPTGMIGTLPCFDSVVIESNPLKELRERDFRGKPVRCKVWTPNAKPLWVGIASAQTVEKINEAKSRQVAVASA